MKDFGLQMLLLLIGASFILFVKGVLKSRDDGDAFDFGYFIASNLNRLMLLAFGLIVVSLGLFFDPIGLESVLSQLPLGVKIGSPLVIGAALSGVVLILPTNKPKE